MFRLMKFSGKSVIESFHLWCLTLLMHFIYNLAFRVPHRKEMSVIEIPSTNNGKTVERQRERERVGGESEMCIRTRNWCHCCMVTIEIQIKTFWTLLIRNQLNMCMGTSNHCCYASLRYKCDGRFVSSTSVFFFFFRRSHALWSRLNWNSCIFPCFHITRWIHIAFEYFTKVSDLVFLLVFHSTTFTKYTPKFLVVFLFHSVSNFNRRIAMLVVCKISN